MRSKERLFPVTVYFDKDDYRKVRNLAKQTGLSLSDICRMCTLYVLNEVMGKTTFSTIVSRTRK